MQDADKKNIKDGEEYEQLSFDFCKPDTGLASYRKPRIKIKAELPKQSEASGKEKDDDDGYEQLSFDFVWEETGLPQAVSKAGIKEKQTASFTEKEELGKSETGEKIKTAEPVVSVVKSEPAATAASGETAETAATAPTAETAETAGSSVIVENAEATIAVETVENAEATNTAERAEACDYAEANIVAASIEAAGSIGTDKTTETAEGAVETETAGTAETAATAEAATATTGTEGSPKSRRKSCNKSHIIRNILVGAAALSAAAYCVGIYFFSQHFLPNSFVQSVDISYLSADEAEAKLHSELIYDSILLNGRTGEEVLNLNDADAVKTFSSMQDAISAQDKLLWIKPLFIGDNNPEITFSVSCNEDKLNEEIEGLSILEPDNIIGPANAHPRLNSDTNQYEIEAEVEGNEIDTDTLKEAVHAALNLGIREIDLDKAGVYTEPDVRSDSEMLSEQIAWMNLINKAGASLNLDAGVIIPVNGEFVGSLVGADGMADEQAVRAYVSSLAAVYNTASPDKQRSFINHNNEEKTIKTNYGWELNEDKTFTGLFELINKVIFDTTVNVVQENETAADVNEMAAAQTDENDLHADEINETTAAQTVEGAEAASDADTINAYNPEDYAINAVWKRKAAVHGENDLGQNYIEIDMGEQNVYVYVDGNCVLTTPCVTGRMTRGRITPEGMYQIQYKQKNRYLTGRNPDGSISYRSYVHYWMPFNGGIGLHDATWRGKFGGNIYVSSGSHGCINLPLDMAKQLYDIVYAGMPVICYY